MKKRFVVLLLAMLFSVAFIAHGIADIVTIYPEGFFIDEDDAKNVDKMINNLRTDEGLKKLAWDASLVKTAQQRAIEFAIYFDHVRPNNSKHTTAFPADYTEPREIVNGRSDFSSADAMFSFWRDNNAYRQDILDDKYDCFGVAHVTYGGIHFWALCLAHTPASGTGRFPIQRGFPVEISSDLVKLNTIQYSNQVLKVGEISEFFATFTMEKTQPVGVYFQYKPYEGVKWTVSKGEDIVAVEFDEAHKTTTITGLKPGTATLKAEVFGKTKTATISVLSDSVTVNSGVYSLNHEKKTAELQKPEKTSVKNLKIPDTVKANGITYKVTAVAASACKGLEKLAALTIGKNVVSIGAEAFSGCKALKTITIKTSKLKADTVGDNAFTGIYKKATVKCPSKKLKDYKKFLLKKGVPSGAKFKHINSIN